MVDTGLREVSKRLSLPFMKYMSLLEMDDVFQSRYMPELQRSSGHS